MVSRLQEAHITSKTRSIIEEFQALEGPMLPILHAIQDEFGYVPTQALPVIADALNISRAEVHGVVTFYHDYRSKPAGRHIIKICRAEACQSMGGDELADKLLALLGVDWHETSPDGSVTIEPVYCLGLCACAPSLMLDGEVIGRLDAASVADIATQITSEARP